MQNCWSVKILIEKLFHNLSHEYLCLSFFPSWNSYFHWKFSNLAINITYNIFSNFSRLQFGSKYLIVFLKEHKAAAVFFQMVKLNSKKRVNLMKQNIFSLMRTNFKKWSKSHPFLLITIIRFQHIMVKCSAPQFNDSFHEKLTQKCMGHRNSSSKGGG